MHAQRTAARSVAAAGVVSALTVALLVLCGGLSAAAARTAPRPCSAYPTPGTLAPAGATLPAGLVRRYAVLRRGQRPADRLRRDQLSSSLTASGLMLSETRLLGRTGSGGRVYLIPAEHLLGFRLAPARCLAPGQRSLESELRPRLQREYRHRALCIEVLYRDGDATPTCASAGATPDSLLFAARTPAFGLVPDGVSAVTVTFLAAPPRTVRVRHNLFVVTADSGSASACGVQWLQWTGNVSKVVTGCSYLGEEIPALDAYRTYVAAKLSTLASQVAALTAAIDTGSLAQAQPAWLAAHLTWLQLGQDDGAYGCFGALGGEIDGLAAGHPEGTADPGFTGFHRIELDLWTDDDLADAARQAVVLQRLVSRLMQAPVATYLPATANGVASWLLRPHEVLEDALRDSLTGDDDYGSGTDLESLAADVAAVQQMLGELEPVLDPLAPGLAAHADGELVTLLGAIDGAQAGGTSVSIRALPTRVREQLDADVDAALETLAPVPELLTSTGRRGPTS